MSILLNIVLQAAKPGFGYSQILFLVLIIAVFYLFFIRPQSKKAKDQKKFREALQKGDKVVTIGGIHGKILEVRDTTVILEVEGGTRLKLEKTAIALGGVVDEKIAEQK